jgi:hypothetical protein
MLLLVDVDFVVVDDDDDGVVPASSTSFGLVTGNNFSNVFHTSFDSVALGSVRMSLLVVEDDDIAEEEEEDGPRDG